MSAAEMLEMLLLELLESSLPIEGVGPGPGSRTGRRRGKPATVIPIERRRARVTLRDASTLEILRQRSLAARQRSSAACERGKAAREAAERIRAKGLRLRPACESA